MLVAGQRANTYRLVNNGFVYYIDSRYKYKSRQRFICSNKFIESDKCSVILWKNNNGDVEVDDEDHNHLPPTSVYRNETRKELQTNALLSHCPAKDIVEGVFQRNPCASLYTSESSARRTVHLVIRKNTPSIPPNFNELATILAGIYGLHNYYLGMVVTNEGTAYIGGNDKMLQRLKNVEEIHIDSTFLSVPDIPEANLLLTIHIRISNRGFPAIYALCNNRSSLLYTNILQWMLSKIPEMRQNLKVVVTDLDSSILLPICQTMPWVKKRSSWFQFFISKKWNSLNIPNTEEYLNILHLIWTLPLFSSVKCNEAWSIIEKKILPLEPSCYNLNIVKTKLHRLLTVVPDSISIYNSSWQTLNIEEDFNRRLSSLFGCNKHPTLLKFCSNIRTLICEYQKQIHKVESRNNNTSRVGLQSLDREIKNYIIGLESKKYTLPEFMTIISKHPRIRGEIEMMLKRKQYQNDRLNVLDEPLEEYLYDRVINPLERMSRQILPSTTPMLTESLSMVPTTEVHSETMSERASTSTANNQDEAAMLVDLEPILVSSDSDDDVDNHNTGASTSTQLISTASTSTANNQEGLVRHADLEPVLVSSNVNSDVDNHNTGASTSTPLISTANNQESLVRHGDLEPVLVSSNVDNDVDNHNTGASTSTQLISTASTSAANNQGGLVRHADLEPILISSDLDDDADGHNPYVGELYLYDEPYEEPWIHQAAEGLSFDDSIANSDDITCILCCNKAKAKFATCGHRCLCLRCKFMTDLRDQRDKNEKPTYRPVCMICRTPYNQIDEVFE